MDDETTVGIRAEISLLHSSIKTTNKKLDRFLRELRRDLGPVSGIGVTGSSLVFNLGTPPPGFRWRVRAIQVTGPSITAIANVNTDIYVGGANAPSPGFAGAANPPSIGNWWASSGNSATPGSVPFALFPSTYELEVTDPVFVVLSGTGVTNGVIFYVSMTVDQLQGFSGLDD